MKTVKGTIQGKFKSIIGIAAKKDYPFYNRSDKIYVSDNLGLNSLGYLACITGKAKRSIFLPPIIENVDITLFDDHDIIQILENGEINFLWEINSQQNVFLLTESCNCNCLMCPQPVKPHNPQLLDDANRILDLLKDKKIETICITGGEPTLLKDKFINFLLRCIEEHPESYIDVLTNGKLFSDEEFTKEIGSIVNKKILFCVSLHSDIAEIHDKIVNSKDSYRMTQEGIYNLAKYGIQIEIRHVINKLNYKRLVHFADHLYNYFPFCSHYALMAMEIYGSAQENSNEIVVNPPEYINELADAVLFMNRRELPVSVYNVPLCMCDTRILSYCKQSISKWKNIFVAECEKCCQKDLCCGFFATSSSLPINHIKPFLE